MHRFVHLIPETLVLLVYPSGRILEDFRKVCYEDILAMI